MYQFLWSFSIFCWQDIVEITILCALFLYITHWCKKETTKPLLMNVYAYTFMYFTAYALYLPTLSMLLMLCAPLYGIILLFIHKDSIQKRFIPIKTLYHEQSPWTETAIQTALIAASNAKSLVYVLEQTDQLAPFVNISVELSAPLTKELLLLITTSSTFTDDQLLMITSTGKLHALATSWKKDSLEAWFTQEASEQHQWIQDALLFTTKTDALIFRYNLIDRSFTVISQGTIHYQISAPALLEYLSTYSPVQSALSSHEKGKNYVPIFKQQTSTEQSFL